MRINEGKYTVHIYNFPAYFQTAKVLIWRAFPRHFGLNGRRGEGFHKLIFLSPSDSGLVRPQEFIAIEVNQMLRVVRNPHFRFPSDVLREFSKRYTIGECRHINNIRCAVLCNLIKLCTTQLGDRV